MQTLPQDPSMASFEPHLKLSLGARYAALALLLGLLLLTQGAASFREKVIVLAECPKFVSLLREGRLQGEQSATGNATETVGRSQYARDPRQCWSRAEWRCFQGRAQVPGRRVASSSLPLRRALNTYRRNWRQCHRMESTDQVAEKLIRGETPKCKYLFWSMTSFGLGNRMVNLVSTFVLALLTKRILLVESHAAFPMSDLLCEPFPDEPSWELARMGEVLRKRAAIQLSRFVCLNVRRPPFLITRLLTIQGSPDFWPLRCQDTFDWVSRTPVLFMTGNQYFLPMLYTVNGFGDVLRDLFPSGDPYAIVASFLIRPSNAVWRAASERLLEAQRTSPIVMGVQIRNWGGVPRFDRNFPVLATCYANLTTQGGGQMWTKGITVYMTSLGGKVAQNYLEAFNETGLTVVETVMLTLEKRQASFLKAHNQRAFSELVVLALSSDVLYINRISTFGYLASALSHAPSFFIREGCPKTNTCFHVPYVVQARCCSGNATATGHRASPYIQDCADGGGDSVVNT